MRPLAIDLYCGLGGWTEGLLAEGYRVVGFDIERHEYGDAKYPAQMVIQDVSTLHGRQFRDAALIVASPPCQDYSYMAMPWTRARAIAAEYRSGARDMRKLTALFDACFRIRREASEAAGRHIPLVVENVRGAQPWVGRATWHYGSYYLWGDIPTLMPIVLKRQAEKNPSESVNRLSDGYKSNGLNWSDRTRRGQDFTRIAGEFAAIKNNGGSWFNFGSPGQKETNRNPVTGDRENGVKHHGSGEVWFDTGLAAKGSKSAGRKAASAAIAKIPFVLAQHIARSWKPLEALVEEGQHGTTAD